MVEFGVAQWRAISARQRARTDFRAGLIEQAQQKLVYGKKKGELTDLTTAIGFNKTN